MMHKMNRNKSPYSPPQVHDLVFAAIKNPLYKKLIGKVSAEDMRGFAICLFEEMQKLEPDLDWESPHEIEPGEIK